MYCVKHTPQVICTFTMFVNKSTQIPEIVRQTVGKNLHCTGVHSRDRIYHPDYRRSSGPGTIRIKEFSDYAQETYTLLSYIHLCIIDMLQVVKLQQITQTLVNIILDSKLCANSVPASILMESRLLKIAIHLV